MLLLDQDRARWDQLLIRRGLAALERAERLGGGFGPYALQAAIAACHARALTAADTDWERIAALYDALAQLAPSPVVELNRAVAVAMAFGPAAGLEVVDALARRAGAPGLPPAPERARRPARQARPHRRGARRAQARGRADPQRARARDAARASGRARGVTVFPAVLFSESTGPEDAPVLLMGSSLGTSLDMWDSQLALAERLRIVRHDHRGHGRSPVPPGPYEIADLGRDVLELMDALEIERASYCGLSIGGMVGMWLGANAPERIERLVLICTSAHLPPAEGWAERAAKVRAAGTVEVVADAVVARWLTPAYAEEHPELVAELRAMLVATDPEGYAAACGAIERMDLRDQLGRIAAPTLVISGAGDEATPPEHQELIAASIPGARLETVDPAAHLAAVERPALVNELIAAHLA